MTSAKEVAEAWLRAEGITWDTDALEICHNGDTYSGPGLAVMARRDLKEGEVLCTIPKSALLSIRNSEVADVVEEEELGGGLGLVFVVAYEMCRGDKSRWHGYFQSMPKREYLPIFWSDAELSLLKGTELDGRVESDRELARCDYDEAIAPLLQKYPDRLPATMTYETFTRAASLVASRAFGVDEWHGESMVPLADIFNHKASIVSLSGGYQIMDTSGAEAPEDSGSDEDSKGREEAPAGIEEQSNAAEGSDSEGNDKSGDGESSEEEEHGMAPILFSNGPSRPSICSEKEIPEQLRLEIGICSASSRDGEDEEEDLLQIVAASDISAHAEVHNTYGELSNADLVNKYGFALRGNPFDVVTLQKELLVASAEEAIGEAAHDRTGFLLEHTSLLDDDVEPLEVMADGRIGPALVAALMVFGASAEEFSGWKSASDAFPWLMPETDVGEENAAAPESPATRHEAPQWLEDGGLTIAEASAASLTKTMGQILTKTIRATLESRYGGGDAGAEDGLAKAKPTGSTAAVLHDAAQSAARTLKSEEKGLLQLALKATEEALLGTESTSSKRGAADVATCSPDAKKAKR